jgi:hypothetical protein
MIELLVVLIIIVVVISARRNPNDAEAIASPLQYCSTALVTGMLATYHGLILRSDLQALPAKRRHIPVTALLDHL